MGGWWAHVDSARVVRGHINLPHSGMGSRPKFGETQKALDPLACTTVTVSNCGDVRGDVMVYRGDVMVYATVENFRPQCKLSVGHLSTRFLYSQSLWWPVRFLVHMQVDHLPSDID